MEPSNIHTYYVASCWVLGASKHPSANRPASMVNNRAACKKLEGHRIIEQLQSYQTESACKQKCFVHRGMMFCQQPQFQASAGSSTLCHRPVLLLAFGFCGETPTTYDLRSWVKELAAAHVGV